MKINEFTPVIIALSPFVGLFLVLIIRVIFKKREENDLYNRQ